MPEPVLRNLAQVILKPEQEENAKALEEYRQAKKPAEDLLRKQRAWMEDRHGGSNSPSGLLQP